MPELELTPELVGPHRNRLMLAYIEGVMLWPGENDAGTRARAYAAAEALQFRELVSKVAAIVKDPIPLNLSDISAAMWRNAEPPRIDGIQRLLQQADA